MSVTPLTANDPASSHRVYDVAKRTPLDHAPRLSLALGNSVYIKREDLQPIFSFKLRGAYNKIAQIVETQQPDGVICASAGNHAQGVALAATRLGIKATIVMPITTPPIKIDAVVAHGGAVIIHGDTFDDASAHAQALAKTKQLAFIHPFDDELVIAGQGTVGSEILDQAASPLDIVFVPVGGGGLIAGVAEAVKLRSPGTKIVGVEPQDAASLSAALDAGTPVTLPRVGAFADGVAVKRVGDVTFAKCQEYVDDVITVNTDEMCAAIKDLFLETRVLAEPAGAISLAGMRKYVEQHELENKNLVVINSGANMNFDRLSHIVERADIGAHREALFAIDIPEQPGSFLNFCQALGQRDVTEFNYRFNHQRNAHIFVGVRLQNGEKEKAALIEQLDKQHYPVIDLTDNYVAKLHLRHLVGGSTEGLHDERLLRFEFPERPGALMDFLSAVGIRWNISLFHYRNHGSDFGRVLCGIQVPDDEFDTFMEHIQQLNYPYWDESDNPAYRLFLASGPN